MKRLLSGIAAVTLALGGLAGIGALSAGATTVTTPTITVTPSTGLTNNETVSIAGSGFAPGASLLAVECLVSATSAAGCNAAAGVPIQADANGVVAATNFTVTTGTVGNGTCGTTKADATCAIAVGTASGVLAAGAVISFASGPGLAATPSTGLKSGATVTLSGSGFTDADTLYAVECLRTATSSAGCDTATATPITVSSTGTIPTGTTFKVVAGAVGNGTCGTSPEDYSTCVIQVANATGTDAAATNIDFSVPLLNATPSTALKAGSTVTLTGSQFTPGETVYAVECVATATTTAGCDLSTATPITVGSDGTLASTPFKVVTGTVGNGSCGTSASNLSGCIIEVATQAETDQSATPITFALVAAPKATGVSGYGIIGASSTVTIKGSGFTPKSKVTGPAGTTVIVEKTTATAITLKVKEATTVKKGSYTLKVKFTSGKTVSVKFSVK